VSARIAEIIFRFRHPLCAAIVVGFLALLPLTNLTGIDNDLNTWISEDDPIYRTYERFRREFGGQRTLLIALQSDRLFTPDALAFIREVTEDIERVDTVQRVQSLATANVVTALPSGAANGEDGGIEVRPLLDDDTDDAGAERVRERALGDALLRGDLVSDDGTVTALVVSFDEDRIDDVRSGVIEQIHQTVDPRLPEGMRAYYNGSLEISETYNRVTTSNMQRLTPPIVGLTLLAIYVMFRSWRITGLLLIAIIVSAGWTLGLYVLMGFTFNILASMLPPLVMILAIADDVHIVQHFNHALRATGSREHAFKSSVQHLLVPLFGASATTALGLASLVTSEVVAVRAFGAGAAVGVMVDFVMSIVLVPTLLMLLKQETGVAPQERYLIGPMRRVARFSMAHARAIVAASAVLLGVTTLGIRWLQVDTNHINFFAETHPLHQSAKVIDSQLSGIYSFNILLEGEPDSLKTPDALRRMEQLRVRLEELPFVRKVVSVADYVKRVNRELNGGDEAQAVVPASAEAIAQELFVFGLSDEGRRELERVVASDYSRAQVSVKLASMSSDLVFEQIALAEQAARQTFDGSGIAVTATGSGRMFAALDHYIVVSQLSSFATAFLTVFAVIFVVFRSARYGLLAIVANALPVCAVLGLMGWLGISLNVATVMVASVALGVVDDDTIHFIGRFRREVASGAGTERAIETATMHEGRASLTTAIINSLGYGVMILSAYKPTAWFGGLLALTMAVAFLAEVFVVPAIITLMPSVFGGSRLARVESLSTGTAPRRSLPA
jgi:predicted RND superfamily exporter protein